VACSIIASTYSQAPIAGASGIRRVVLARVAADKRLRDASYLQAFAATCLVRIRACYGTPRIRGATHHQALRALANRLSAFSTAAYATAPTTTKPLRTRVA
jgi:hypothetical protein